MNSPGAAVDAMVPATPSAGASYSATIIRAMQQQGPPYADRASSASGASSLPVSPACKETGSFRKWRA